MIGKCSNCGLCSGRGGNVREGCDVIVAVAGQPNVGKSTLFNVLTGETARVANWPGVTVERKEGVREFRGKRICFIDLPGTYGISASSLEEVIAREYIVSGEPDLILVLVDSTAPERTLYLPIQILELTPNVIIALTKTDLAHGLGIHIHVDKLEAKLGVPVIATSAIKGIGIRELFEKIIEFATGRRRRQTPLRIDYGGLEPFISEMIRILKGSKALSNYPLRWAAIRLLEGDQRLEELMEKAGEGDILKQVYRVREAVKRSIGKDPVELIVAARYNFVDSIAREIIVRVERVEGGLSKFFENVLSKPIIGPLVGIAMLLAIMVLVFSINTGFPLNLILDSLGFSEAASLIESVSISGLINEGFNYLSDVVRNALEGGAPPWLTSLIADGIIPGVGSVLSFFPLILLIFVFLAMLEDSGIAPRLAISFHNFLSRFGFSGRAIYPLMISLGCNVPGVMASRTSIEDEERYEVIFSVPFIPCQARLIVTLAFITSLFTSPLTQSVAFIFIYVIGFTAFLITGYLIRRLLFRKIEPPELIIEIPTIHRPNWKVVWWISWDYSKHFLKKAGIIIFGLSIISWFLLSYGPSGLVTDISESYGAYLGRAISPLLIPYGLSWESSWRVGYALINGFVAKEGLIEAIVLLQGGEVAFSEALRMLGLTTAQAYAILILMMLYVPCLATIAVMYQESRSVRLTLLAVIYMLVLAYVVSLIVYFILSIFV